MENLTSLARAYLDALDAYCRQPTEHRHGVLVVLHQQIINELGEESDFDVEQWAKRVARKEYK